MPVTRKVRLSGIMSVVTALAVVFVWWVLIVPHTTRYKDYMEERQMKARLKTITPPADARLTDIQILRWRDPNLPHMTSAMALYSSKSDCSAVEAYYKEEFAKHGFVYSGEIAESKKQSRALSFSATDYTAQLSCSNSQTPPQLYEIILWSNLRG
jgi:hypothetical protein